MDRGMRAGRRLISTIRSFQRALGPASPSEPLLNQDVALVMIRDAAGQLPYIQPELVPVTLAIKLYHSSSKHLDKALLDLARNPGTTNENDLKSLAVRLKDLHTLIYTRTMEKLSDSWHQRIQSRKKIADAILDYAWQQSQKPSKEDIKQISRLTKRTVKQVTKWFENRRARYKNKPAKGPSKLEDVVKIIAQLCKPEPLADPYIFEDELDHPVGSIEVPVWRVKTVQPPAFVVESRTESSWPALYRRIPRQEVQAFATTLPPSKTDPPTEFYQVTASNMVELMSEMGRLSLRHRVLNPKFKGAKTKKKKSVTFQLAAPPTAPPTAPPPRPIAGRPSQSPRSDTAQSVPVPAPASGSKRARNRKHAGPARRRPASTTQAPIVPSQDPKSVASAARTISHVSHAPTSVTSSVYAGDSALDPIIIEPDAPIDFNALLTQLASDVQASKDAMLASTSEMSDFFSGMPEAAMFGDAASAAVSDTSSLAALANSEVTLDVLMQMLDPNPPIDAAAQLEASLDGLLTAVPPLELDHAANSLMAWASATIDVPPPGLDAHAVPQANTNQPELPTKSCFTQSELLELLNSPEFYELVADFSPEELDKFVEHLAVEATPDLPKFQQTAATPNLPDFQQTAATPNLPEILLTPPTPELPEFQQTAATSVAPTPQLPSDPVSFIPQHDAHPITLDSVSPTGTSNLDILLATDPAVLASLLAMDLSMFKTQPIINPSFSLSHDPTPFPVPAMPTANVGNPLLLADPNASCAPLSDPNVCNPQVFNNQFGAATPSLSNWGDALSAPLSAPVSNHIIPQSVYPGMDFAYPPLAYQQSVYDQSVALDMLQPFAMDPLTGFASVQPTTFPTSTPQFHQPLPMQQPQQILPDIFPFTQLGAGLPAYSFDSMAPMESMADLVNPFMFTGDIFNRQMPMPFTAFGA